MARFEFNYACYTVIDGKRVYYTGEAAESWLGPSVRAYTFTEEGAYAKLRNLDYFGRFMGLPPFAVERLE